jgi:inner membrane protein
MPTIFTHPAIPLALGLAPARPMVSPRLLWAGVICSVLPDLDVIAFQLDIPYGHAFGHRGFTHSIVFAVLLALLAVAMHRLLKARATIAFTFILICTLSHGVLDAMTTGGLGIAFLWPYEQRYFLPWRFIQVSPIGFSFFSPWGLAVLRTELLWIWLPALIIATCGFFGRRIYARAKPPAQSHVHLPPSQGSSHTGSER